MSDPLQPKLGACDGVVQSRVWYPDVFSVGKTTGPDRLIVGPSRNHVEVLLALAELWKRDYVLLYVLLVPRQSKREPGRYQSPAPLTFDEISSFCRSFAGYLEGDGRHHLWVGSPNNKQLLVYDRHEWIYAYGEIPAYIEVLKARGFTKGEINLPAPHCHNYNEYFDVDEDRMAEYWEWKHCPLHDGDDA